MAYVVLIGPHFTVNILSLLRRFIEIIFIMIRVILIYHKSKCLRSKRRSSPCIFQVVVSLSIRAFVHISPRIFSCFQLISVKKYQIFDEKFLFSKYFVYILQQLPSMRTTYPNLRTGTLWERNWHAESCRHDVSCCIGLIKLLFVVSNDNYGDLCENLL